jgi:hypothetical protein
MRFNQGHSLRAKENGRLCSRVGLPNTQRISIYLCGLICLIGWARVSLCQQPNVEAVTGTSFSSYLGYAGQALKVGTAITALLAIVKAITEWTASGRKNRALEKATRLATFIEALTKRESTETKSELGSELLENAQREFALAANRCYRTKAQPSKIRRAFLIYLPPRLVAYIPHFLFFTLCALAVSATVGIISDILDKTADMGDLAIVLVIGIVAYFMQQWAALEWRKSQDVLLQPRRLFVGFKWYPANSFWGLFANSFLIIFPILVIFGLSTKDSTNTSLYSVWPVWQRIVFSLVGCQLFAVGYLWCRAEFLLCSGEIKRLSVRDLVLRVVRPQTPEGLIGLLAFSLLTIWCCVLLLDLRFVQQIASFGDGSVGTAGAGAAYSVLLVSLILYGVIPWIAVYRGLSDLLDHGRIVVQEVKCD